MKEGKWFWLNRILRICGGSFLFLLLCAVGITQLVQKEVVEESAVELIGCGVLFFAVCLSWVLGRGGEKSFFHDISSVGIFLVMLLCLSAVLGEFTLRRLPVAMAVCCAGWGACTILLRKKTKSYKRMAKRRKYV